MSGLLNGHMRLKQLNRRRAMFNLDLCLSMAYNKSRPNAAERGQTGRFMELIEDWIAYAGVVS
jgi:hypothetical protein